MPTIAIDFDGTISNYDGWRGKGNFGTPIKGTRQALLELKQEGWILIINTTRLEIHQVREYLDKYKIPYDHINFNPENIKLDLHPNKIIADVYLDDRSINFNGDWIKSLEEINNFETWWRKKKVQK